MTTSHHPVTATNAVKTLGPTSMAILKRTADGFAEEIVGMFHKARSICGHERRLRDIQGKRRHKVKPAITEQPPGHGGKQAQDTRQRSQLERWLPPQLPHGQAARGACKQVARHRKMSLRCAAAGVVPAVWQRTDAPLARPYRVSGGADRARTRPLFSPSSPKAPMTHDRATLLSSPATKAMGNFLFTLIIAFGLSGCGYNTFQTTDEQIKASWAEVLNQYQRRADLVPNLVNTVKGAAAFEQDTLVAVINARARATAINATPELVNDPQAFAKFTAAQGELSGALSRLLVVAEKYPDLKANSGFRELQAQLEGTENRIVVARERYIRSVQDYNVAIRSFPSNLTAMVLGYSVKANFTVTNEKTIAVPPVVSFGASGAKPESQK